MPKLWQPTIEAHRQEVRDAILDSAAALVAAHGLRGVSMSRIAAETGIGRATLYKYFDGVEAILLAWHERHIGRHLTQLAELSARPGSPLERLEAVLAAYALIARGRHSHGDPDLAAILHRHESVARAEGQLQELVAELIAAAAESGEVRNDVAPEELASFCLHALAAAGQLSSRSAIQRLVGLVVDGLR